MAKIATGEIEETLEPKSGRTRSGQAGAKARADKLSREERREIGKQRQLLGGNRDRDLDNKQLHTRVRFVYNLHSPITCNHR